MCIRDSPLGATDTSTAPGNEAVKSVASLVSVTGNDATVNMKSNYPTVDKKIIPAQSGSGLTVGAIVNPSWEGIHQGVLGEDDENAPEDTIAPHGAADEKKAEDFAIGDTVTYQLTSNCLLYTSDAADEEDSVDLGGRRLIKKKKKAKKRNSDLFR